MTKEQFKALFNDEVGANGFYLMDDVFVFRKPLSVWDSNTGEEATFRTIDELWEYMHNGKTIGEYVEYMDELLIRLDGGLGAEQQTFKFDHAKGNGKDESKQLFPAYANVRIKAKSLEGAIQEFHERFENEDHEWAYEVDPNGYVHQFVEGNSSSVSISGRHKDNMILHNHPSGGAFSDSDLISTSLGNQKGIVASGKNGDYIFQKSNGFKATEFVKAVKTAKLTGTSYDDAVDKWLTANQKKYGYKYEFKKSRKR